MLKFKASVVPHVGEKRYIEFGAATCTTKNAAQM
jgi:hypothetical protein